MFLPCPSLCAYSRLRSSGSCSGVVDIDCDDDGYGSSMEVSFPEYNLTHTHSNLPHFAPLVQEKEAKVTYHESCFHA